MGAEGISYKGYQYIAYYTDKNKADADGKMYAEVVIARRKLDPGTSPWERSTLQHYKLKSEDTHNRLAMLISEGDGVIHLSFDHHADPYLNYASTAVGTADNPESVVWNDDVFTYNVDITFSRAILGTVTYPVFTHDNEGGVIFYYRQGGSNSGSMNMIRYDASTSKWEPPVEFSTPNGTYQGNTATRGPYTWSGMQATSTGEYHVAWLWRESSINCIGPSGPECNQGIYHTYTADGGKTWLNKDGDLLIDASAGELISIDNIGERAAEIPAELEPSNVAITSAIDPETDNFHVLNVHKNENGDKRVHHYVWDSATSTWSGVATNIAASNLKISFVGDKMFMFDGRSRAFIHYATRDTGFTNWTQVPVPSFDLPSASTNVSTGYTTWDISRVHEGYASIVWHTEVNSSSDGDDDGTPTPIYVYEFQFAEPVPVVDPTPSVQ